MKLEFQQIFKTTQCFTIINLFTLKVRERGRTPIPPIPFC